MSNALLCIATRGSALALAQANLVLGQCRAAFPHLDFDLKIVKTTGDELQSAALAGQTATLPKGLFTKELEFALLDRSALLAVHSLKDLPTELPAGLVLGAVGRRADVRDVLIYRSNHSTEATNGRRFGTGLAVRELPAGAVVATSSTRRKAQLLALNPALRVPEIRGNVGTRLRKVAQNAELDATILALAGLSRLNFRIDSEGHLEGDHSSGGLLATILETEEMLPCVGQGAIGIEIRKEDALATEICARLNDFETQQSVSAERAFLAAMGGGCQSPVAAHAQVLGRELVMRAISFADGPARSASSKRAIDQPLELGQALAAELKPHGSP